MSGKLTINKSGSVLPKPRLQLSEGMRGVVYDDPLNRLRVEGNATLVSPGSATPVNDSTVGRLESWYVVFAGETKEYLRWVNVKDFNA